MTLTEEEMINLIEEGRELSALIKIYQETETLSEEDEYIFEQIKEIKRKLLHHIDEELKNSGCVEIESCYLFTRDCLIDEAEAWNYDGKLSKADYWIKEHKYHLDCGEGQYDSFNSLNDFIDDYLDDDITPADRTLEVSCEHCDEVFEPWELDQGLCNECQDKEKQQCNK